MSDHLNGQKALLVANWKMNPTSAVEASDLVRGVLPTARRHAERVQVAICPPYPWLLGVSEMLEGAPLQLGAQDCFWEPSGPYTGEVSAAMIAGWCQWVITGHSERRTHFGETDAMVARKTGAALRAGLQVVVCVGEHEDAFSAGRTAEVVSAQVRASLGRCVAEDCPRIVVAYEPVWAIGTGRNADPEHAYKTMRLVRTVIGNGLGEAAARSVRVLYGGSVNAGNVDAYVELPLCDGVLVGGASLDGPEFSKMIEMTAEVYGHAPAAH